MNTGFETPRATCRGLAREALERWDNEGGGMPDTPPPVAANLHESSHLGEDLSDPVETGRTIGFFPAS